MDTQTVGLLERFAGYVPDGSGRVAEALGYVKDDVTEAIKGWLDDYEGEITRVQIDALLTAAEQAIDAMARQFAEEDSPIDGALSEFMRDEVMGVRPVPLVMTPQEFAAARADNAANAHRRTGATVRQGPATKARRAKRA